jgi:hypothetical protein
MTEDREAQSPDAPKRDRTPAVSRVFSDGTLIELLYRASDAQTTFAVWRDGEWTIESEIEIGGERLVPFSPKNNINIKEIPKFRKSTSDQDLGRLLPPFSFGWSTDAEP